MDIFLQEKVELSKSMAVRDVLFSKSAKSAIMAVLYDREIHFLDDRHQPLFAPYIALSKVTAAGWYPAEAKFAIGHESGLVSILNLDSGDLKEEAETHTSEVTRIDFSANGALMMTQDRGFTLAFWRGMSPVKTLRKDAPVNVALFITFNHERKDKLSKLVKLGFLGDKLGSIEYFEEKRLALQELCKINGSIKEMFFYGRTNSIVVITSTYYFIQFKISTEEDIVPDKKLKLSMANGAEHLTGLWLEPDTLLLNSKEPLLKFWNVADNSNYSLNLYDLAGPGTDAAKLKVSQLKLNARSGTLYCLLSSDEVVVLQRRAGVGERAWRALQSPELDRREQVTRLNVELPGVLVAVYPHSLGIFKTAQLKLFADAARNLKFLVKSNRQVEYFETLGQDVRTADSGEAFEDLLIVDQTIVVLTKRREVVVSTLMEFLGGAGRLSPLPGESGSLLGLKKFSRLEVADITGRVLLAKNGYLTLSEGSRLTFVNYKTSVQSEYCPTDKGEVFQTLEFGPGFEHFVALGGGERQVLKVFDVSQDSLKTLHESVDLAPLIEASLAEDADGKGEGRVDDSEYFLAEPASKETSRPSKDTRSADKPLTLATAVSIERMILDQTGNCVVFLTNAPRNNLVFYNILKRASHFSTVARASEVESLQFDKTDPRFFTLVEKRPEQAATKSLLFFVLEEDRVSFFDRVEIPENRHLLGSAFPETYLGYYDLEKRICTDTDYPSLFAGILREQPANATLKAFAREFCFNISSRRLNKALVALKRLERSYEMDSFWKSLFDMALDKRNLKVAELCLGKMKFVRAKQFSEMRQSTPGFATGAASDNQKLGQLALAFNNLPLAKRIFFEEGDHLGISQILFREGRFEDLLRFCRQHEKSLLNYYFFELAKLHKANGDYSNFFLLARRSRIPDEFVVRALDLEQDSEVLARYLQAENSRQACLRLFLRLRRQGETERARECLEKHKELKPQLAEFLVKQVDAVDAVKALAPTGTDPASARVCLTLAAHKENLGDHCAAVELLVKGQHFLKAIALLTRRAEFFDQNENFKARVLDLMFNQVLQAERHYATGALASYFVSLNLIEKAVKLYLHAGECQRAHWLAKSHNLVHLVGRVEGKFSSQAGPATEEPKARDDKPVVVREPGRSTLPKEAELGVLIDGGEHEQALAFLNSHKHELRIDEELIERARKLGEPARGPILAKMAKALFKAGQVDRAVSIYLELKDNARAFKAMMRANQTAKIIQFANFCREDEIFIQAANYLQTSDMKPNDQVFTSIVLFYCKAKQFRTAIEFLRNFSTTCFEAQDRDTCLGLLEKAEKLVDRLPEADRAAYGTLLAKDMLFLSKYAALADKMSQMSFAEAVQIAEELLDSGKGAIYWSPFVLYLSMFMCYLNMDRRDKVVELGSRLEGMDAVGFNAALGAQEKAYYFSLNPDSKLRLAPAEEREMDDIEENLI